jgi:hypothetical protein
MRNGNNLSDFTSVFWHEPLRLRAIEFLNPESLWVCEEVSLPEHRKWSEYLPLFTLMWFDEKKVLIRVELN